MNRSYSVIPGREHLAGEPGIHNCRAAYGFRACVKDAHPE